MTWFCMLDSPFMSIWIHKYGLKNLFNEDSIVSKTKGGQTFPVKGQLANI